MSKESFQKLSRVIRFDSKVTRQHRRATDKLAPIRDLREKWIGNFHIIYNPHENLKVDEQLLAFRGHCPFRQYMPSKPAKYGIKCLLCDSKTKFADLILFYNTLLM